MIHRSAIARYNRRVLLLSLAYALLLIGAVWLFRDGGPGGLLGYAVAILPALPILGIFAAIGRYLIEEHDEYLRMLMVRQTLVASAFALGTATIWGFLESFGLAPHVESYAIAVLWFGGLGLGACVNKMIAARAA